jgi:hypothetical protein
MKNAFPRLLTATAGFLVFGLTTAQAAPASSNRPDDGRFSVGQAAAPGQSRTGGQENPATNPNQRQGIPPTTGTVNQGEQVGRSARSGGQENPATSPADPTRGLAPQGSAPQTTGGIKSNNENVERRGSMQDSRSPN